VQIFIDSAEVAEIKKWLDYGIADGVTTNPSIILQDGVCDIERCARDIATLVAPRPVSVEVTTNDLEGMVTQAREFAGWAPNIVVKIPVINESGAPCLGVIRQLETENIRVNCTAILSFNQLALAAKAGATYVSIFAGRVSDEGHDAAGLISASAAWLQDWGYKSRIIVGSIRAVMDIQMAALAGAHIITVPPPFLIKMVDHKYTRDTVRGFIADAKKALEINQAR
jgi:transaldolase